MYFYGMKKENKQIITIAQYAEETGKAQQNISRLIKADRDLPGITEYYQLWPNTWILKKASNYAAVCKKLQGQKYIIA